DAGNAQRDIPGVIQRDGLRYAGRVKILISKRQAAWRKTDAGCGTCAMALDWPRAAQGRIDDVVISRTLPLGCVSQAGVTCGVAGKNTRVACKQREVVAGALHVIIDREVASRSALELVDVGRIRLNLNLIARWRKGQNPEPAITSSAILLVVGHERIDP